MELLIETKSDDESFEVYDPNWLYLKVTKFVEGENYDFSKG